MGDVINLRSARKSKARAEKDAKASANRAKFGRPRAEIKKQKTLQERDRKALDAHLLSPQEDKPE
jgi:hypothetical protein